MQDCADLDTVWNIAVVTLTDECWLAHHQIGIRESAEAFGDSVGRVGAYRYRALVCIVAESSMQERSMKTQNLGRTSELKGVEAKIT